MARISTYKALLKFYESKPEDVKCFFKYIPKLISDNLPYEIAIAYAFLKIEQAQNRSLYGGVVKVHRGNSEFTRRIMNFQHLTRDGFKDIYNNVFGHAINEDTANKLKDAEKARDKVIHGKEISNNELREAIADILDYAEAFNEEVYRVAGFKPLADMRGFKGSRANTLDKRTTKWLMRGLGFGVKA